MRLSDFDFNLPQNLVAQSLHHPRDYSRLLVYKKKSDTIEHYRFIDLPYLLQPGDVIVLNNSKVIPARIIASKPTGGRVELLLDKNLGRGKWTALIKGKNLKPGQKIFVSKTWFFTLIEPIPNLPEWIIKSNVQGKKLKEKIIKYGKVPTPPYIKTLVSKRDYQTTYAQKEGSIAAPTAGLHFTNRLLNKLQNKGIQIEYITLHVGYGTFRPITSSNIKEHSMLPEWGEIKPAVARRLNQAKQQNRRIIAVGTTTVRTLEGFSQANNRITSGHKDINIFIYPGYDFKFVDAIITNFHLPRTTPLVMAAAFLGKRKSAFLPRLRKIYQTAIKHGYRFYSLGDGMIILP